MKSNPICLAEQMRDEFMNDILPFWSIRMKDPAGGFYGLVDGNGKTDPEAVKGAILNARILWTFSSAWRVFGDRRCLETAERAFDYIKGHFLDREYGGVYWSVDASGMPADTRKQFYAIAFTIYGMAEYYRAAGNREALDIAAGLFLDIENHSFNRDDGGYLEAAARDWSAIADMRLSEKDRNDARTMNTHLHILEAYASLYRVWKDSRLEAALRNIIRIFLDRIVRPDGHLGLFFTENWESTDTTISYGHDIEASWLLCEAADVLGDIKLREEVIRASIRIAEASMEGFSPEGGMVNEYNPEEGRKDGGRDWWVQAETVIGCFNQYQLTGERLWLDRAASAWAFIKARIICPDGEWYWSVHPSGEGFIADTVNDRAGFWKCPYHNGRMCMEMIERHRSSAL